MHRLLTSGGMDNSLTESEIFLKYPFKFVEMLYDIGIPQVGFSNADQCSNYSSSLTDCISSEDSCVYIECFDIRYCMHPTSLSSGVKCQEDSLILTTNSSLKSPHVYLLDVETSRFISWKPLDSSTLASDPLSIPSHIVVFEEHVPNLSVFFVRFNFSIEESFFYAFFDSKSQHMLIYSKQ